MYPGYSPLPAIPHVFNTNWILTDYTKENGAFCIVPGSHKYCRHPEPGEGVAGRDSRGSSGRFGAGISWQCLAWGVSQAHSRSAPLGQLPIMSGRITGFRKTFTAASVKKMLARNDARFRELLNYDDPWGWEDSRGPIPWHMREKIWDTLDDQEKWVVNDAYYNRRKIGKNSTAGKEGSFSRLKQEGLD